jgi:hypothetical protein
MDISQLDSNDRTDVALGDLRTTGDQTTQNNILRVCSTMGRPVHDKSTSSTSTSIRGSPVAWDAPDAPFNPNLCLIAVAESGQHLLTLHSAWRKACSFHPPLSSLL